MDGKRVRDSTKDVDEEPRAAMLREKIEKVKARDTLPTERHCGVVGPVDSRSASRCRATSRPQGRLVRPTTLTPRLGKKWSRWESNPRPLECHAVQGRTYRPRPCASIQEF